MHKLLVLLLLWSPSAVAKDFGKFGQTFEIKEENLIEYMQRKMQTQNFAGLEERARTPAPVAGLSRTETERIFFRDPSYKVQTDIRDHEGNVVHKAGTVINPLDHVQWGADIVLINGDDKKQVDWIKAEWQDKLDQIKVVLVQGSPIKLEEQLNIRVYFDQSGFITSHLGIKHTPAIISQADKMLKIRETLC